MQKKEIVADGIPVKINLFVTLKAIGLVAEFQCPGFIVKVTVVHDQTVYHLPLGQVGNRVIDPKHIFTERTAAPLVAYPFRPQNDFVAGCEESDFVFILLIDIEKIAFVGIDASGKGEIFDIFGDKSMQADIFVHRC
jgi:hypothetical protein